MSMQNNIFRVNEMLATGGYYIGPAGTYNKKHSAPYYQESEWTAFTPTSTTGTVSSSTSCRYKVMGNVCVVNFGFNYVPDATVASGTFGGLPFNCKSQVSTTVMYGFDTTALFNYSFRLLTTVDAKTFTITGLPTGFTNPRTYIMGGQLMYKIKADTDYPVNFISAITFFGNTIIGREFYFPGARTNIADRLFYLKSNTAASTLAAGANMTSLDTNNSVYRITNNTVMFWLAIVFTKDGAASFTVTITGLPYNATLTSTADCDITRNDTDAIIGGTATFSSGTISIANGGAQFTNSVPYRVFCFIQYELEP